MTIRREVSATIVAAILTVAAGGASAAIYTIPFGGITGSQTIGTALEVGDGVAVLGNIQNQPGAFTNEVTFTLAPEARSVKLAAAWFAIPPFGNSFDAKIEDSSGAVVADDTFLGFDAPGVIRSVIEFAGLTGGETYNLVLTGNITGEAANYDLKMGVTPIPAAALLLGPALGGLGLVAYRRRKVG
jgi:hypothetical protein